MSEDMERLYQERLARYVTAMRNGKPDRVPIRPFVAEFTAKYAGFTCQEVTHDYRKAFEAVIRCAKDFDWDAVVPNMVYVWTGLTMAIGLKYYAVPGIDLPADKPFQYLEPPEEQAFMRADEYDLLIADPTGYLYNIWLPRVCPEVVRPGEPATMRNNLSFVRGGMAMMQYFDAFGTQIDRLRRECGVVPAWQASSKPRWISWPTSSAATKACAWTCSASRRKSNRRARPLLPTCSKSP